MVSDIRFEKRISTDPITKRKRDEVVVIRNGCEVAVLPEADRLDRALSLPLEEPAWIADHFEEVMHREPTGAEREFWQAVVEHLRGHNSNGTDPQ